MIRALVVVVALGTTAAGCASPAEAPILTRLAQGSLDSESGAITEPGHEAPGAAARGGTQL